MTDFEATSLTLQAAAIATSTLIGLGQIAVVWFGIRRMVDANRDRTRDNRRLEQENQRRHTESMTALQSQGQALAAIGQALERQGQALDLQGRALETLLARQEE